MPALTGNDSADLTPRHVNLRRVIALPAPQAWAATVTTRVHPEIRSDEGERMARMPGIERLSVALAFAAASISACTAAGGSDRTAEAVPAPVASFSDVRLTDRTGPWTATLGPAADRGRLSITVTCFGGGRLTVEYRSASAGGGSSAPECDGLAVEDQLSATDAVTVTITPDGDQRWSAEITRAR